MKSVHLAPIFVLSTVIIVTLLPAVANGANILFFMGLASHSHRVALQPLAEKLVETGHKVSFLTYMKSEKPHPNITEFFPESARQAMSRQLDDIGVSTIQGRLKQRFYDPFRYPQFAWEAALSGQEITYLNDDFKDWLQKSHFDLIIYDNPLKEIANGIAYKMKAKVIGFVTPSTPWMQDFDMFGLPSESSWLPDWSPGSEYSLIPHRFAYAYNALWWYFSYKWYYLPKIDEFLTKIYGEELPPIEDLIRRIDLVFLNEHFSSMFPRSLPPFMIPVGGMFCKESKGILPKQDVLAHPKCKGFLTQGGGMSFQQAAFHGVPMIVVPMWGDQNFAASSAVYRENGIHLELADINKESLTQAFQEILHNPKYLKNAVDISKQYKDRPMSPIDTAVWWT
ncbi:unnamed protein product, partial [Allacma fusca]